MARKTQEELLAEAQQRVADLEARAVAKDRKRHDQLQEQRAKLVAKAEAIEAQVNEIDEELVEIIGRRPTFADSAPPTDGSAYVDYDRTTDLAGDPV